MFVSYNMIPKRQGIYMPKYDLKTIYLHNKITDSKRFYTEQAHVTPHLSPIFGIFAVQENQVDKTIKIYLNEQDRRPF